jgi:importin subunit beta-1
MQLTALLQAAQSADASVRTQAEQTLSTLQQQQYGDLCVGLSVELADPSKPVDARRLAGLILKNTLDAKEEARKVIVQWKGPWDAGRGAGSCATNFDHMP